MATPAIRSRAVISATLMNTVAVLNRELTDFVPGSVVMSLLEAYATQIQRLEQRVYDAMLEGVEVGTYRNFNFTRLSAQPASGTVTFTRVLTVAQVTIPAGSLVSVPGDTIRVYETIADVTMAIGVASVVATVQCTTAGTAGNTAATTITQIVSIIGFPATVTNPNPLLNGKAEELDNERQQRFAEYLESLSKGTRASIHAAVTSGIVALYNPAGEVMERVTAAYVRDLAVEGGRLGLVDVYIDNGGGTASAALVTLARDVLYGYTDVNGGVHPGWVAAGIELRVFAVVSIALPVTATVTIATGYVAADVKSVVQTAIEQYLLGLQVFDVAVLAEIIAAAMEVPGVADIQIATPTANTIPEPTQRVIPGTVTVL